MTNNIKNSKNITEHLADAVKQLRCQEIIALELENGNKIAIYPAEFLNAEEAKKYKTISSPTVIKLAKRAGLLPVMVEVPAVLSHKNLPRFSEKLLREALEKIGDEVFETARAKLPMEGSENAEIITFRTEGDDAVHLALIIGKAGKNKIPLVRVHSSCVTGDLLGSLRCDCGDQLKMALEAIKKQEYGILLYMNQEGRGIGITNKIRAYALQDSGMDTYEANHALGFESDERDFGAASAMLKYLGITKINLLSNNPYKVSELEKHGITIAKRKSLIAEAGSHNHKYIATKAKKAGHIIGD